jgi:DNA-binding transcriptional MerR regulator
MSSRVLSIRELAGAAGVSVRAIRFYVQQKLLPPPYGLGRGRHYGSEHVQALQRVLELQAAGYALDAIRKIMGGHDAPGLMPLHRRQKPSLSAELWTRLRLMDGVELQFDASRHSPDVQDLLALKKLVIEMFQKGVDDQDAA